MLLQKVITNHVNPYLPPTNRWLTLFASIPVAIAAGSAFVYSAYSTQLAERCRLDASLTANLGIMVSIGGAIGGVFSGLLTDLYGTQMPILFTAVFLSGGYYMVYYYYLLGPEASILGLSFAMFFTGLGTVAGYFSSLKAVAMNFPNHKGSAQCITIAALALAGMLFLYISSLMATGDFLWFLATSCGLLTLVGFIFIREGPHVEDLPRLESPSDTDVETEPETETETESFSETSALILKPSAPGALKNLSLSKSLAHPVFWFHYFIFAITQGFGQMYIYSVGYVLKAIFYHYTVDNDSSTISLQQLQALHVSLISVSSFIGRLCLGPTSDYFVKHMGIQRHWTLILGNTVMLAGHSLQLVPIQATFDTLYSANLFLLVLSCLIGFAYGFTFTGYPVIISDLFSMKYNSFIWGCLYTSTTFGMSLMCKLFGVIYDINSTTWDKKNGVYICAKGSGCYHLTFEVTSIMCVAVIGIVLGYIRYRYAKA